MNANRGEIRILILCGDADGNLGDRAILQATCIGARAVWPTAKLSAVASDSDWLRQLGVHAVPRGPYGFFRLCAIAARSDLVLCGGGGLFQDDDSLIKMPYWGLRVALARLLCRDVVGYSLGVGPLRASTSRLFARLAFGCMKQVSVRDPVALRAAQALTRKQVSLVPDPALLLSPRPAEEARRWLADRGVPLDGRPLLGVALRRWFPPKPRLIPHRLRTWFWRGRSIRSPESDRLTDLLAQVLDDVVRRHDAFVIFLPTYTIRHEGDDQLCDEVLKKMSHCQGIVLAPDDPALYKGIAGHLTALLGGRMHPTIFAASVGTPVVGLAYNPKFHGFFQLLGLSDHVLAVEDFVHHGRTKALSALLDGALTREATAGDCLDPLLEKIRDFNRTILNETRR